MLFFAFDKLSIQAIFLFLVLPWKQAFLKEVYALREKYNLLVKSTPITDNKSYEEARCRIRFEDHRPNFGQEQKSNRNNFV